MRYNSAILAASLFSLVGLIIPSHHQAEGASLLASVKNSKLASASTDDCTNQPGDLHSKDCKSNTKASKIDLDRKGHKVVKKSKR